MRKILFTLPFLLSSLFYSCNDDNDIKQTNFKGNHPIEMSTFKNIHQEIKYNELNQETSPINREELYSFEKMMVDVSNKAITNDEFKKELYQKVNIPLEFADLANWSFSNEDNSNFYEELQEKYQFKNEREVETFFNYLELYKVAAKKYDLRKGSLTSCQEAALNAVVVTVIFTGVSIGSGGVGLPAALGFVASKTWALRNLIKNCRR